MPAAYQDIQLDQGADFAQVMVLTNPDGTPTNVNAYIFSANIKTSYTSANVIDSMLVVAVDATNGNIKISYAGANSANIPAGHYVYDVVAANTPTTVRLLQGIFYVTPGVTGIAPIQTSNTANSNTWIPYVP